MQATIAPMLSLEGRIKERGCVYFDRGKTRQRATNVFNLMIVTLKNGSPTNEMQNA